MSKKTVLFLHGFASSAKATKAQYFKQKFVSLPLVDFYALDFNPTPQDFEYMTITGLINRLRQFVLDRHQKEVRLIGSSLGALVGLHYAHRFGGVRKMLFLAPALSYLSGGLNEAELRQWQEQDVQNVFHYAFNRELPLRYGYQSDGFQHYLEPVPPAASITIIHGRYDDIVPLGYSRHYVANFPDRAQLIEVDSDHLLHDQLELIWDYTQSFLLI